MNTLAATAWVMLLCNPVWLFDVGFQLSFLRDSDSTIRKNQDIIFKRIEASETAQIKAYKHIVSFLDAKGKTGLLDDINKNTLYESHFQKPV